MTKPINNSNTVDNNNDMDPSFVAVSFDNDSSTTESSNDSSSEYVDSNVESKQPPKKKPKHFQQGTLSSFSLNGSSAKANRKPPAKAIRKPAPKAIRKSATTESNDSQSDIVIDDDSVIESDPVIVIESDSEEKKLSAKAHQKPPPASSSKPPPKSTKASGKATAKKKAISTKKKKTPSTKKQTTTTKKLARASRKKLKIKWKDQIHELLQPLFRHDNAEEICEKAFRMSGFYDLIEDANDEDRFTLNKLKALILSGIRAIASELTKSPSLLTPTEIKRSVDREGVYGLSINDSGKHIKYGMSCDCFARADRQNAKIAFKMASVETMKRVIPKEVIQGILDLQLPGLNFHKDHVDCAAKKIASQIFAAYLAAAHINTDDSKCVTNTVLELLVAPRPRLSNGCDGFVDAKVKDYFAGLSDNEKAKVYVFLNSPTMKSVVYELAKKSHPDLIGTRLPEPPEGSFLTLYCLNMVMGRENISGWQDVVPVPPEQKTLDEAVEKISRHLEKAPDQCSYEAQETIKEVIDGISGKNNEYYVRPEASVSAMGFVDTFRKRYKEVPDDDEGYILVEDWVWGAVQKCEPEFWQQEMIGAEQLRPFPEYRINLITTSNKRKIIVVPSFFLAFAPEDCRLDTRIKLVQTFIAFMKLLGRIGLHSPECVDTFVKEMVSYLMALEFGRADGGKKDHPNRDAARNALPKGYFRQPYTKTLTVGKALKMNIWHVYFLELVLGEKKFRHLMMHRGFLADGAKLCPTHPDWRCPGVQIPELNVSKECPTDPNNKEISACLLGLEVGPAAHVLFGRFVCQECHRKFRQHELLLLQSMDELSPEQRERLVKLENSTRTALRNQQMERDGRETVLRSERLRTYAKPRNDTIQRRQQQKVRDRARQNNPDPKKKKPSTPKRDIQDKKRDATPYPDWLAIKFEKGCLELFKKRLPTELRGVHIQKMMIRILELNYDDLPVEEQDGKTKQRDLIKYRKTQFKIAASKYLEPVNAPGRNWSSVDWKVKTEHLELVANADKDSYGKSRAEVCQDIARNQLDNDDDDEEDDLEDVDYLD